MHKVTKARSRAFPSFILSTACLPKVRYRTKFSIDGSASKPAAIEVGHSLIRVRLVLKLAVDVAHEVIPEVVAHVRLLNPSVLVLALDEHLLEEVVVVLLHLLVAYRLPDVAPIGGLGRVLGVDVEVLQHKRLAEGWLIVDPTAAVSVPAGSDLEVEAAVDFVLLCAED